MVIARITGQGLLSIAVLVAVLWGCVIGDRILTRSANEQTFETLHAMRMLQLKKRQVPASTPARVLPRWSHPPLG